MIKKIACFSLLLAATLFSRAQECFFVYTNKNTYQKVLVINPFPIQDSWSVFNQAVFDTPAFFACAQQNKLPVIIMIPHNLDGYSPLDNATEWLEGMRVALAWASMYARFSEYGSVDVRFVKCQDTLSEHQLCSFLSTIIPSLTHPILTSDTMTDHFYTVDTSMFNQKNDCSTLHPCNVTAHEPETVPVTLYTQFKSNTASKVIVIAGAAGFIGTHLVQALLQQGHRVIGLDNFACSSPITVNSLRSHTNFCFFEHDITKPFTVSGHVDCIVHLASLPSPVVYYRFPKETLMSGLIGTKNMLDLAVEKEARFLFASTSEVYGDPDITPQHEQYPGKVSPVGKRCQYDQSKRGAETLLKYYVEKHALDVRIARLFNTYGPHMNLEDGRVVTNFIGALLHNKPMKLYGDGNQTRSFAYVSDTVKGLLSLLSVELPSAIPLKDRVVNIGNDGEFTIQELAHAINKLAVQYNLQPVPLICVPNIDATDPKMRRPDLTRARTMLSYAPTVSLEEGLQKTIAYFIAQQ